jgi:hypothetical protein
MLVEFVKYCDGNKWTRETAIVVIGDIKNLWGHFIMQENSFERN